MRLLLDTHIALWMIENSSRLPGRALELISNPQNSLVVSDVSLWEIAIKRLNRPDMMKRPVDEYLRRFVRVGMSFLPLDQSAIMAYESLNISEAEGRHRDPFDRMLVAQSKSASVMLLTHDKLLSLYDEPSVLVV